MENCKVEIFSSATAQMYNALLRQFDCVLDIYYQTDFLALDAEIQKGKFEIFTVQSGKSLFVYPYIKLPFENPDLTEYFDITSPYGYCGPFCNDPAFFDQAELLFIDYISKNCVTEFVRYHFEYNRELKFQHACKNIQNRTIVTLDSAQSWETIWTKEFSGTNRNVIRKLEKEEYVFAETGEKQDLDQFVEMYYATMKNAGAGTFYYFEKELIYRMYAELGEKIILVKVEKEGIVYSYSLFFLSGGIGTYYLSARNLEHGKVPATNYLLSKSIELLKQRGIETINFGGGLTNDVKDHLFRFKSNFSKTTADFYIGKRIFQHEIYAKIADDWSKKHGQDDYEQRKHILQFYR